MQLNAAEWCNEVEASQNGPCEWRIWNPHQSCDDVTLLACCSHWWMFVHTDRLWMIVNNRDVRHIITVCFKLGHKTKLSDHKWNTVLHKETSVVCIAMQNNIPRYRPVLLCLWPDHVSAKAGQEDVKTTADWPPPWGGWGCIILFFFQNLPTVNTAAAKTYQPPSAQAAEPVPCQILTYLSMCICPILSSQNYCRNFPFSIHMTLCSCQCHMESRNP